MVRRGRKKGCPKTGGREPGTPNRATVNARAAIAHFVENNIDRLQGWLDEIAADEGPRAAWDAFWDSVEYHVPKLQRTELNVTPPPEELKPITITDANEASDVYAQLMMGMLPPLQRFNYEPAALPAPTSQAPVISPPIQETTAPMTPRAQPIHPTEIPVAPRQELDKPTAKPDQVASPGAPEEASLAVETTPRPREWGQVSRLNDPAAAARRAENERRREIENERTREDARIRASRMEQEE